MEDPRFFIPAWLPLPKRPGSCHGLTMPFTDSMLLVLLATIPVLCAIGLVAVSLARISRLLVHIEQRLHQLTDLDSQAKARAGSAEPAGSTAPNAFEDFLREDPARRRLPKREQFAAYRVWRQENGLNWSRP